MSTELSGVLHTRTYSASPTLATSIGCVCGVSKFENRPWAWTDAHHPNERKTDINARDEGRNLMERLLPRGSLDDAATRAAPKRRSGRSDKRRAGAPRLRASSRIACAHRART